MRVIIGTTQPEEGLRLRGWVENYCALCGLPAVVSCVHTPSQIAQLAPGAAQIVFVGFGGGTGFRTARTLCERDRACRIILIDDTAEYAIKGIHLHFADFILRPVEFRHVVRGIRLALGQY